MTSSSSASWLSKLKGLDAYPKTIEEFKVRTSQGGFFSLLAMGCVSLLLVSELRFYFATDTVDKMVVDGGRNHLLAINFDVEFPLMPCAVVALESVDMAGNVHHDIEHDVEKTRLDRRGKVLAEGVRDVLGGAMINSTELHKEAAKIVCGSCYSAGEPEECCNTCADVEAAYVRKGWLMPSLHTIAQCQELEVEKVLRGEVEEGCRIKGTLVVSKVAGKLYFAPSKIFRTGYLSSQDLIDATFDVFDTSHTIHSLSFGEAYPDMKNLLDNRQKKLPEKSVRGSFQYFLKVVPTEYTFLSASRIITNQFSVTEHFRQLTSTSDKGLPMVSFSYTFSPIMFRIEQYRVGLLQFLTSVCAIVGGVFTILGIMDSLAFRVSNRTSSTPLL
uniref:Endoplasmic reticulum-Golgi intermediate compartment protein 3 n=1 Tax=Peronospora matthiolae TaxID=2874970 RepID=A0AAV1VB01_9STRA